MTSIDSRTAGPLDAGLADRLAALPPEKRELLERLLLERRGGGDDAISRRDGAGPWPLSYAQELMWLLDRLTPGSNAYNSPDAMRLEGRLDLPALQGALDRLVARTEILRTTYDEVDGAPVQVVHPPAPVRLRVVDLTAEPSDARTAALDRLLKQEAERPYDLRRDPILRAVLVRLAPDDAVLLLTVHHIAVDGWSKAVLWRELAAAYDALAAGGEPDLPPPPLQYADWAVWHRRWLESGPLAEQLDYWRRELAGAPELLDLPADRPRPAVRTGRGDRRDALVERAVLDGLHRLAREENATLFMVVLAAFGVLLQRWSGQDDVVVGTPIAGRQRVEVENLVGYFMNTLALRVDLGGEPTFRELLRRVRERVLGGFAHQDVPFERVVAELNPTRDLSRTPLFQVMLVLQNQRRARPNPVGLVATPYRHERGWAKFDLTLGLGERADGLNSSWEFSTDLFDAATVTRMSRQFAVLLATVVDDPDRPVGALPLLPDDELRLLRGYEAGPPPVHVDGRLHDLVTTAASRAPDAPAVVSADGTTTHRKLQERANRLAHHLRSLGVRPEQPVAICLGRGLDLVVAQLGTLKAGGCCVPLDPAHPAERLRLLLDDSGAAVLLTTSALRPRLPVTAARVVALDTAAPAIAAEPAAAPACAATAASAAYVLYTSGSTGRPKGVVLEHRGLAAFAVAAGERYQLGPADRTLQFASPGSDISIEEIFATLAAGGCVVVRPDDLPLAGRGFLAELQRTAVTVLDLPTAFWHEWVADLDARGLAPPRSLRLVIVGGEKASAGSYAAWRRIAANRVGWINTYGPAEASVVATAWAPGDEPVESGVEPRELPIGRPLPGVVVRLLDRRGRRVPLGARGELHIGGVGVARGYLGSPTLSAERFGPDPYQPGGRLYRTGDLARWRPTGTLEFVGRLDAQLKVRGFRVEPAEVENTLLAHPAVSGAFAMLRTDGGGPRLVAYAVVAEPQRTGDLAERLRRFLADRLPAYLVPAAVVPVRQLPLTVNGKVDPAALPAPAGWDTPPAPVAAAAPVDDVERRLAVIWREVLGHDAFGRADSFFDVGGDSLLAVRVFARVERAFGRSLPLATLITSPTLAALAAVLRADPAPGGGRSLVALRPTGHRPPLFLVHEVGGELLSYRELLARLPADQPVYGLRTAGLDRTGRPLLRIEDMAADYLDQVRTVAPIGPYLFAGFCFGGVAAYEMAVQLRERTGERAFVGLLDASPYGRLGGHETLSERARRRVREFRSSDPQRRPAMLPETASRVRDRLSRSLRWSMADRRYLRYGRPLPTWLRDPRLMNWMAAARYVTPAYDGPVTLFLSDGAGGRGADRREQLWRDVVEGPLQVRRIAAPGVTHLGMMVPPHVSSLAAALDAALVAAAAYPAEASS